MASASRRQRVSPRTVGSLRSHTNDASLQASQPQIQIHKTSLGNSWLEPPLRPPQPSFMDHNLDRGGVLEQMVPLGTYPTAKVKARSKGIPIKKVVQARNLDGMVVDDARATPEVLHNVEHNGIDGQESFVIADMDGADSGPREDRGVHETFPGDGTDATTVLLKPPSTAHLSNMTSRRSRSSQPPSSTQPVPLPDLLRVGFTKAFRRAIHTGDNVTEQNLMHMHVEALHDPEFALLLKFALTNNSLDERGSAVNRKLRELKRRLRNRSKSRDSSVVSGTGAINAVEDRETNFAPDSAALESPMPNRVLTFSPSHRILNSPIPNREPNSPTPNRELRSTSKRVLHSPTPNRVSPPKTRSAAKSPEVMNGHANPDQAGTARKKRQNVPSHISRRSSTSSLSSIDEGLAAGPPPFTESIPGDPSKPSLSGPSLLDDDDVESNAKRMRLIQTFDGIKVTESNMRPTIILKHTRRGSSMSLPKMKRKPPLVPTRNGFIQDMPSPQSDVFENRPAGTNGLKRPSTPTTLDRPPKKPRTTAKVKMSPQKPQQQPVIAGIAQNDSRRHRSVGFDDTKSEQSDNNDYCTTCSGPGFLLCCDGCDRSFHFTCVDPPLAHDATLSGPWLCFPCRATRELQEKIEPGLFSELLHRLAQKNPTSFHLPLNVRDYFDGVRTGENGEYVDVSNQKPNPSRSRIGYDDPLDYQKLRDAKGNAILCVSCNKSSLEGQDIITCDHCSTHWHLDCLNPPLANPPNRSQHGKSRPLWMCPLHIDHDLRCLDPVEQDGVRLNGVTRTHRVRRPKNAKLVEPALRRGFKNNGLIEIADDSSDEETEWEEDQTPDGVIYKLPTEGVKLDFIDKVKSKRLSIAQIAFAKTAETQLRTAQLEYLNQRRLSRDILSRRTREQITALNLTQFATENADFDVGANEVENLLYTLEAEAPPEVIDHLTQAEVVAATVATTLRAAANAVVPPSPPASSDPVVDGLGIGVSGKGRPPGERERQLLRRLQRHIALRLGAGPEGVGGADGTS